MARKKNKVVKENSERWLLTYADLITLLMVFFVILFALSQVDKKKYQELAGSLNRAFNVPVLQGSQPLSISDDSSSSIVPNLTEQADFTQVKQIIQQFNNDNNIDKSQITATITSEGISVTISGVLLFYNGTNQIKPDGVTLLQKLGTYLLTLKNNIRVEGHTDDIPVESTEYPTNWELSAARAVAVTRYLIETSGLVPTRLSAVGYGQYQPIEPNDTREHREANRRAVLVVLYGSNSAGVITPVPTP